MGRLDNKVAFITGVARGQGRSHALRMSAEGAGIIGLDLCQDVPSCEYSMSTLADLEETGRLVAEGGGTMLARQGDVRDRESISAILAEGIEMFGHVDIVLANAGIAPLFGKAGDTVRAWQDSIDVLLTGAFNTADIAADHLVAQGRGGSIVFTSSVVGLRGPSLERAAVTRGWVGYIAAKAGVIGVMRHFATVLGPYGIRSNSIHPTSVNTPMADNAAMRRFSEQFPRVGGTSSHALPVVSLEAEDVANAALWLCTDEARYVTGVALPVDAGYIIK